MRSNKFQQFLNAGSNKTRIFRDAAGVPMNKKSEYAGFKLEFNSESNTLEIVMHDTIGDWWSGLDSATVVSKIKEAKGQPIDLDINSFGGDAYAGIAIYNALAMHDAKVTARITGIAYSAASVIPMAADEIVMAENGSMGIHPAWLYCMGNKFALKDYVSWLETLDGQIIDTYTARTGKNRDEIVAWFHGENHDGTVFSGKQCMEYGFADALIPLKTRKESDSESDSGSSASNDEGKKPRNDIREKLEAVQRTVSAHKRSAMLDQIKKQVGVR